MIILFSVFPYVVAFMLDIPLYMFRSFAYFVMTYGFQISGVGPGHPALNVSLTSCERVQVSGYSRTKLGKYAYSFRLNLAPLVTVPERLHSKIQVCVHR